MATRVSIECVAGCIAAVVGICLMSGCQALHHGKERSIAEMPLELRQEADVMLLKHQRREFQYVLRVPILGVVREVPIAESLRGADYGFLEVPNDGYVYAHDLGKYTIYTYDRSHLFVVLNDRYAMGLHRTKWEKGSGTSVTESQPGPR